MIRNRPIGPSLANAVLRLIPLPRSGDRCEPTKIKKVPVLEEAYRIVSETFGIGGFRPLTPCVANFPHCEPLILPPTVLIAQFWGPRRVKQEFPKIGS